MTTDTGNADVEANDGLDVQHVVAERSALNVSSFDSLLLKFSGKEIYLQIWSGADAIKKFTPSLGIPYLGVWTPNYELGVTFGNHLSHLRSKDNKI